MSRIQRVLRIGSLASCILAVLLCGDLAWRSRKMPYLGDLHDDSVYWVSAKSLADGHGYRIASLPGQPFQTKYPPLYPWLLSLIWRLAPSHPENLPWAMALDYFIFCLLILVLRALFRQYGLGEPAALLLCAVFALNPFVNLLSISLMSEPLFLLLLLASMLLAESVVQRPGWRLAAVSGVVGGLAYLTRTAGLPLLLTVPLVFALRRRYQNAFVYAVCLGPFVMGWMIWSKMHFHPAKDFILLYYLDYFGYQRHFFHMTDLPALVSMNAARLWNGFAVLLGVTLSPWLSALIGLVAIAGVIALIRSSSCYHYGLFALVYVAALLIWTIADYGRLLFPVFPLLLVGFWTALRRSAQLALSLLKDASSWTSLAALAIILTLLSFTSLWLAATMGGLNALWGRAAGSLPWSKDVLPAYAWISTHTPPDSIVIARRDCVLYLNTGRASFFPYPSPRIYYWPSSNPLGDYSSLTGIAHKYGARYVLVSDNSTERVLHPMLFPHNELLDPRLYRKAFSSGSASVYEILPE